jgi:hypothetical protein
VVLRHSPWLGIFSHLLRHGAPETLDMEQRRQRAVASSRLVSFLLEPDRRINAGQTENRKEQARAKKEIVPGGTLSAKAGNAEKQEQPTKQYDQNAVPHLHGARFLISSAPPLHKVIHRCDDRLALSLATARKTNLSNTAATEATTARLADSDRVGVWVVETFHNRWTKQ